MNGAPARPFVAPWLPVLLLAVLQTAALAREDWAVLAGMLGDADTYMHLMRAERLAGTGLWFDGLSPRTDTPHGEVLHWTLPFSVLLLAGAVPLAGWMPLGEALHLWGAVLPVVLHLATLLVLMWAARPLLGPEARTCLGILYLFQLGVAAVFAVGRPDHHALLLLLFTLLMGLVLRLLAAPSSGRALAAGAVAGLGVWVGVEALPAAALALAAPAAMWLAAGGAWARLASDMAAAAAAVLAVALLLERPPAQLGLVVHDSVSILHLALFAGAAMAALLLHRAAPGGAAARPLAAALAVGGVGAVIVAAWPDLPRGPLAAVHPRVVAVWFHSVAEVTSPLVGADGADVARKLLQYFLPVLPGLAWLGWRARRAPAAERRGWLWLAVLLVAYAGAALWQVRWAGYAGTLAVLPYAGLLAATLAALGAGRAEPAGPAQAAARGLLRLLVIVAFAGAGILAGHVVARASAPPEPAHYCRARDVAPVLAAVPGLGETPKRILTQIFIGPELVYRTPHAVVSSPYHRNTAGILDGLDALGATDPAQALAIVEARGIDLVLVCPKDEERGLYPGTAGAPSLFERLAAGDPPPWLVAVDLPPALAGGFALYRVAAD